MNPSLGWTQEANTPEREDPHWQWRIPNDKVTFMLNPDIALFKDIQVSVQIQTVSKYLQGVSKKKVLFRFSSNLCYRSRILLFHMCFGI